MTGTEFGLLGPLIVRRDGEDVPVPPGKQRAVLAALVLAASRVVAVEDLAEAAWGADPPPSARVSVQNYVMRLRRALGPGGEGLIVTRPGGYQLAAGAGRSDVARFEALAARARGAARRGAWAEAADHAEAALALWRGEPLADAGSPVLAEREGPRLGELRMQAAETRIEAQVRLGRPREVIAELQQLTAGQPLREQLHGLLMLALYQDGRQAEALAAYQRARSVLVAELGTEPGAALSGLHQQILTADPALAAPPLTVPAAGDPVAAAPGLTARSSPPVGPADAFPGAANPFTYGNPISDPRRFFGRRREVEQIFGRLRNAEFESSSVVGDRRIGKTSLLNHLANPAVRASHGLGSGRHIFVYVDLQLVDERMEPEHLWRRLLLQMCRESADAEICAALASLTQAEQLDTFALDELFQLVDERGQHVVFLLDEFERVTGNSNFGPDFYYGLRSLMIRHRLALVTSSRLELVELCHSDAIKSSPFFNIFANIRLQAFSAAEARRLVSSSLTGTGVRFTEAELSQVHDLAGRHPFFLQAASWILYDCHAEGIGEPARLALLSARFRAEAVPHIIDYWDNSSDHERIALTVAAMLEPGAGPAREFSLSGMSALLARAEPTIERIEKRGLLVCEGGRYRLFTSVLGPWIASEVAAGPSEVLGYQEWLAANRAAVGQVAGKQDSLLRELLPGVRARYRALVIAWTSDPRTLAAAAGLLKTMLSPGSARTLP